MHGSVIFFVPHNIILITTASFNKITLSLNLTIKKAEV